MSSVRIQLIYDPPEAKSPLVMAEVSSSHAVRAAARAAIEDAENRAAAATDPDVAIDERSQAGFLRQALGFLLPGV